MESEIFLLDYKICRMLPCRINEGKYMSCVTNITDVIMKLMPLYSPPLILPKLSLTLDSLSFFSPKSVDLPMLSILQPGDTTRIVEWVEFIVRSAWYRLCETETPMLWTWGTVGCLWLLLLKPTT